MAPKNALCAIYELVEFCNYIRRPENVIRVPSGRYMETQVPGRGLWVDMRLEMEHELVNLPRYTAYAKVSEEKDGRQTLIKRKIKTLPLPEARPDAQGRSRIIEDNSMAYCMPRLQIEEEIRVRQERWRRQSGKPPPTLRESKQLDGPPPARY